MARRAHRGNSGKKPAPDLRALALLASLAIDSVGPDARRSRSRYSWVWIVKAAHAPFKQETHAKLTPDLRPT